MKMKNLSKVILIFVLVLSIKNVKAFSNSITVNQQGNVLTLNSSLTVTTVSDKCESAIYPCFAHKQSNYGSIVCTSNNPNAPGSGSTCQASDWSDEKYKYGVAKIIEIVTGSWGTTTPTDEQYYWLENLIKYYTGEYNPGQNSLFYQNILYPTTPFKILNTEKTFLEIITLAQTYATDALSEKIFNSSITSLTFNLSEDGTYYYSQNVPINSNMGAEINLSNPKFEKSFVSSGGTTSIFVFKIAADKITPGTSENLTVTISASEKKYYYSQRYKCSDSVQEVALTSLESETVSKTPITFSGTITVEKKGTLEIAKTDKDTKEGLGGVEFALYKGTGCTGTAVATATTDNKGYAIFNNLDFTEYSYKETKTKDGYKVNPTCKTVKITDSKQETEKVENEKIKGSLEITKTEEGTNKALSGVKFALYSGNGCSGVALQTVTTDTAGKALFKNLLLGNYSFKEIETVEGYKLNNTCQDINIISETKITKSMTNEQEKGSLTIIKKDLEGNLLDGVRFNLYLGDSCSGTPIKTAVTEGGKISFSELAQATYSYKETETVEGYLIDSSCVIAEISPKQLHLEKEATNKKNKIEIIKISTHDNKPLVGAKLHVEDSKGNIVIKQWTTDGKPYLVEGLAAGTYYVVEDSAPEGYVLNKEKIKFVVKDETENLEVEVKNRLTTVEISKVSAVDGKELPGATLQILDKDKNKMSCSVKKNNTTEALKECTWVSGEKSTVIVGLLPGKYYLEETIAPEGYVLNTTVVEFEIKEDGTVDPVVMKNELEVEVPDTLSSRSALLIAISMFDIALGIGILTYVKRNKIEE